MLWKHDSWFTETRQKAADAKHDPARAEMLYRQLYEQAMERGEQETIYEARMSWIEFLHNVCRYSEAQLEAQRFLGELGEAETLIRVRLMQRMSSIAYYLNNYDEVVGINQRILSSCIPEVSQEFMVSVYNQLGLAERHLQMYDEAISHLHQALIITRRNNLVDDGTLDGNLALVYEDMGRLGDALDSCEISLQKAREADDSEMEIFSLAGLGSSNHQLGYLSKAESNYTRALQQAEKLGKTNQEQFLNAALADLYLETGNIVEAVDRITASLLIAQSEGFRELEADSHTIFAWILLERGREGDETAALEHSEKAAAIYDQLELKFGRIDAFTAAAAALLAQDRQGEAVTRIDEAIMLASQQDEGDERLFFTAWRVYSKTNQAQKGFDYLCKAREIIEKKEQNLTPQQRESYKSRPRIKKVLQP